jgi:hypothetical protein
MYRGNPGWTLLIPPSPRAAPVRSHPRCGVRPPRQLPAWVPRQRHVARPTRAGQGRAVCSGYGHARTMPPRRRNDLRRRVAGSANAAQLADESASVAQPVSRWRPAPSASRMGGWPVSIASLVAEPGHWCAWRRIRDAETRVSWPVLTRMRGRHARAADDDVPPSRLAHRGVALPAHRSVSRVSPSSRAISASRARFRFCGRFSMPNL